MPIMLVTHICPSCRHMQTAVVPSCWIPLSLWNPLPLLCESFDTELRGIAAFRIHDGHHPPTQSTASHIAETIQNIEFGGECAYRVTLSAELDVYRLILRAGTVQMGCRIHCNRIHALMQTMSTSTATAAMRHKSNVMTHLAHMPKQISLTKVGQKLDVGA